jgi:hypothetical protein
VNYVISLLTDIVRSPVARLAQLRSRGGRLATEWDSRRLLLDCARAFPLLKLWSLARAKSVRAGASTAYLFMGSALSNLIGSSVGQTFSRDREADDDALWLPVPGDFASKARNRGADKKIAKPFVTIWR